MNRRQKEFLEKKYNDQPPVCECEDPRCFELLGIDWEERAQIAKKGVLVSKQCQTTYPATSYHVIEEHPTYRVIVRRY